jgi:inosine/xanthosine triphosphatase
MKYRAVCLGGTFNVLHAGHIALLEAAFSLGEEVYIGLTSDNMALSERKAVRGYGARLRSLKAYCRRYPGRFVIQPLNDPYGASVEVKELEAIVVSEATSFRVAEINSIRMSRGMRPLDNFVVNMVRTFDGSPLSSTRIINKECDRKAVLLRPLTIGAGTANRSKLRGIREAFRSISGRYFRSFTLKSQKVESGVGEQPWGKETVKGAMERAKAAIEYGDLGVGVEAGLFHTDAGRIFDIQYCAIIDRNGRTTFGHGIGFEYPPLVLKEVQKGKTIGEIMSSISGIKDIGSREGAVGYLSHRSLTRASITRDAVLSALIPRLNPRLYFHEGDYRQENAEGEI